MLEETVVIERNLAVQRNERLFLRDDERIDFHEGGILVHEQAIEIAQQLDERIDRSRLHLLQTQSKRDVAAIVPLEPDGGVDRFLDDFLRSLSSHLLDSHPTSRTGDKVRPARLAIHKDREIQL